MDFFSHGLAVLSAVAGEKQASLINREKAAAQALEDRQSERPDLNQMILDSTNYILFADQIPRNQKVSEQWDRDANALLNTGSIKSLINDIEDDPHLKKDLVALEKAIDSSEFEPSTNVTTTDYKPQHLILFGTGCGRDVKILLDHFDPPCLTIVVSDWHEWASSFFDFNWLDVWNRYCSDPSRRVMALKALDSIALQSYLVAKSLPLLDHTLIYTSPVASEQLKGLRKRINDGNINRAINYLGFVMDEYNMIYNSWQSLSRSPRVFAVPQNRTIAGSAIVCGSGPSLDNNLHLIKQLSGQSLIIACASNYGPLRQAGVDVDVLCLLERGDFMLEQYRDVVDRYGAGQTRLLASVTTPAGLQDLFAEPMVYFRPALTPLSLFAESPDQVLNNEGPQTVNSGVAFAASLGVKQIILCGVDLGTRCLEDVRSASAIGESPRTFEREVPANFGGHAFTNDMLLDGQLVLQELARTQLSADYQLINASDGILIKGWKPMRLDSLLADSFALESLDRQAFEAWWSSRRCYDAQRFQANWRASRPREMVNRTISSLMQTLQANQPWYPNTLIALHEILNIDQGSISSQLAPRILRGHIEKILMAAQRQLIVMASEPECAARFEQGVRELLVNRLKKFRTEIFELFDLLESSPV